MIEREEGEKRQRKREIRAKLDWLLLYKIRVILRHFAALICASLDVTLENLATDWSE